MQEIKKIALSIIFFCLSTIALAQDSITQPIRLSDTASRPGQKVEMADILYQNGKIYLVVLVLLTIFAGIIFYLVRLEKKLNKLEK